MEFENTEYIENTLVYEDYCRLRESVGWTIFPNAEKSLKNSLYTIAAIQDKSFDNPVYFRIIKVFFINKFCFFSFINTDLLLALLYRNNYPEGNKK